MYPYKHIIRLICSTFCYHLFKIKNANVEESFKIFHVQIIVLADDVDSWLDFNNCGIGLNSDLGIFL